MAKRKQPSHLAFVRGVISKTDAKGHLVARESITVEFKQSFGFKSLAEYARTMAAFSNAEGGYIVFGVSNSPRRLVGIDTEQFNQIDSAKLTSSLNDLFDPALVWDLGIAGVSGKSFGFLAVAKAAEKPVICRKTFGSELKAGDIYFRYHGQSRVIGYAELKRIIEELRREERELWMTHVQQIARIGPRNVAFLDLLRGDISRLNLPATFLIDRELLESMRQQLVFVEQGRFTEKDGAPALRLTGDLVPADTVVSPDLQPEKNFPYLARDIAEKLSINRHQAQALIWKLGLKQDSNCSAKVRFGKNATTDKYSELGLSRIAQVLAQAPEKPSFLAQCAKEYGLRNKTTSAKSAAQPGAPADRPTAASPLSSGR